MLSDLVPSISLPLLILPPELPPLPTHPHICYPTFHLLCHAGLLQSFCQHSYQNNPFFNPVSPLWPFPWALISTTWWHSYVIQSAILPFPHVKDWLLAKQEVWLIHLLSSKAEVLDRGWQFGFLKVLCSTQYGGIQSQAGWGPGNLILAKERLPAERTDNSHRTWHKENLI